MTTLYMPLLNEGTDVWRPVAATAVSAETYRIEGDVPEDEEWAFPPDAVVRCVAKTFSDGQAGLTAIALA